MGFCSCTAKFILFILNLACALLGFAVLGIGIYGQVSSHTYGGVSGTTSIVVIVFGAAITLISFFGCWGAIQESPCLLITFGVILSTLLIGLIVIGGVIVGNKDKAEEEVDKFINDIFEKVEAGDKDAENQVDVIQNAIQCCGLDSKDWWTDIGKSVPSSCCDGDTCDVFLAYQDGCRDKARKYFREMVELVGVFALVVGCVEFLEVLMAFFLAHSIRMHKL